MVDVRRSVITRTQPLAGGYTACDGSRVAKYFRFDPRWFLCGIDTQLMTLEQQGAFVRLLCIQWCNGSIPSSVPALASIFKISAEEMQEIWDGISHHFSLSGEAEMVYPELDEQRGLSIARDGLKRRAVRHSITPGTRFAVLSRDGFTCVYCGSRAPSVELELDHVKPVSKGGSNDRSNLVTACVECNKGKRDKEISRG